MAKSIKRSFILEEENGQVYSKLSADNDYGMEMNISDVPNVRIRQPRPTKEKLETASQVRPGMQHMESSEEWLEWYNKGSISVECCTNIIFKLIRYLTPCSMLLSS
jgi:predicted DNA-binding protein (MmcQ/YjbR family)